MPLAVTSAFSMGLPLSTSEMVPVSARGGGPDGSDAADELKKLKVPERIASTSTASTASPATTNNPSALRLVRALARTNLTSKCVSVPRLGNHRQESDLSG